MLELLKEKDGYYVFTYHGYNITDSLISIEKIPYFIANFCCSLNSEHNKKKYGLFYDVTICLIRITSDDTCDVDFICKINDHINRI